MTSSTQEKQIDVNLLSRLLAVVFKRWVFFVAILTGAILTGALLCYVSPTDYSATTYVELGSYELRNGTAQRTVKSLSENLSRGVYDHLILEDAGLTEGDLIDLRASFTPSSKRFSVVAFAENAKLAQTVASSAVRLVVKELKETVASLPDLVVAKKRLLEDSVQALDSVKAAHVDNVNRITGILKEARSNALGSEWAEKRVGMSEIELIDVLARNQMRLSEVVLELNELQTALLLLQEEQVAAPEDLVIIPTPVSVKLEQPKKKLIMVVSALGGVILAVLGALFADIVAVAWARSREQ